MNEEETHQIETGSDDKVLKILNDFNNQHAKTFFFPELSKTSKQKLVDAIIKHLNVQSADELHVCCLETLRILSRDKSGLEVLTEDSVLKVFQRHAGLEVSGNEAASITHHANNKVMVEALKCLCNLIFNSKSAQHSCSRNGCVDGIVQRLKTYKDPTVIHDIKFFDLRMLFLLTALCSETRPNVRNELHGLNYLIEVLDLSLVCAADTGRPLSDQEVDLCSEVLKILFNITLVPEHDPRVLDEEEEAHFMRLVSVLHDLLLSDTASKDKKEDLRSHTVNLLTNMPKESFEELLTPFTEVAEGSAMACRTDAKDMEYDGKNMEAVVVLLDFLHHRLDVPKQSLKESLAPILHCLCEVCRANHTIRKFCRIKVLPYMRGEVRNLPEEGDSLRNKLCHLLTNPVIEVKDLAADFLFVLCKESVARFVKYTGYGNAAGLLAQRGLMCGGRTTEYSSASEESDTEEYEELRPNVNPVTGRWEQVKESPMAGMTEEEKEYEAMQLVEQLDKLQRCGIIQPSIIGPDGKPKPVEHIMELANTIRNPPPEGDPGNHGDTED